MKREAVWLNGVVHDPLQYYGSTVILPDGVRHRAVSRGTDKRISLYTYLFTVLGSVS
jgi:hypothetical protein